MHSSAGCPGVVKGSDAEDLDYGMEPMVYFDYNKGS